MPLHKDLTGADLHEPKGIAAASANTLYKADGLGSGAWGLLGTANIDSSQFKNMNREQLSRLFKDIGTVSSQWQGFTRALTVVKIAAVLQGATATTATVLTFRNAAGASMGTISIPSTGVGGDLYTLTPVASNTFAADTRIQIDTDGGTSTTPDVALTFDLLWT